MMAKKIVRSFHHIVWNKR